MIAEKTADAIRGRKLAPFEPPTRAGANLYPRNRVSGSSAHQYKRSEAQHPPPIGQIYPEQLQRSLVEFNSSSSGGGNLKLTSSDNENSHHEFILNRYGASTMVESIMKRMNSIR